MRLGGENYVLWGGREGYETLLNTDLPRDGTDGSLPINGCRLQAQIGFKGAILIEPKPQEPTKHIMVTTSKPSMASSSASVWKTK